MPAKSKYCGSIMLHILEIYWRRGLVQWWSSFPTMWTVFEIVLEDTSELVESAFRPVLYSAPNGFCPISTFALKTNISCFELI